MISEFYLLDSKLSEKAKSLQLAEEQIWRLFAKWQGTAFDGSIRYPSQFHIRDKNLDMDILKKISETAAQLANADVETQIIVRAKMKEIIAKEEEELEEFNNLEIPSTPISNETQTPQPQN